MNLFYSNGLFKEMMRETVLFSLSVGFVAAVTAMRKKKHQKSDCAKNAASVVSGLGLIPHPEGGFFLETHRSGCEPMTTMGQTGYDCPPVSLVEEQGPSRSVRRPDGSALRNSLTSIYWMPTSSSHRLWLAVNLSDHVHYYHGGEPFDYILVEDGVLRRVTLGPDFGSGQRMQVAVKGGTWKAGLLRQGASDYCLIGEAVAPGFDFHDFSWISHNEVKKVRPAENDDVGVLRLLSAPRPTRAANSLFLVTA